MAVPKEFLDALKAVLFPELDKIKTEISGVKGVVSEQSQRLGDLNLHIIELERKIESTNDRIDGTNARIDEIREDLSSKIDGLREDLSSKIDGLREELSSKIDGLREELSSRIDGTNNRIDTTNARIDGTNDKIDRLYEVIVRRDEHDKMDIRVIQLETKLEELSEKVAVLA